MALDTPVTVSSDFNHIGYVWLYIDADRDLFDSVNEYGVIGHANVVQRWYLVATLNNHLKQRWYNVCVPAGISGIVSFVYI